MSYVPGRPFYPTDGYEITEDNQLKDSIPKMNNFRLGYSLMNEKMIHDGIKVLGNLIEKN